MILFVAVRYDEKKEFEYTIGVNVRNNKRGNQ